MADPNKYTVGWICALRVEAVAAQALLDEEHGRPAYVHPRDSNVYLLGSIAGHNVVITSLPDGEYGTAAAAWTACQMLHSFPNIRMGLMVGVGGGGPSPKNDIRLGDIVVGMPRDGQTGVLEYDFGTTVQGKKFQVKRSLTQPPTLLRNAVHALQRQWTMEPHCIQDEVEAALKRHPRLRAEFQRPPPATDRLLKSTIIYDANSRFDESSLVQRQEPEGHTESPKIWHGTIASGNQAMKDATIRDGLIAEKNVLCFEMLAAGVINQFPCLVVRGICDYSDSHSDERWQGYAAMGAAVYAKRMLGMIDVSTGPARRSTPEMVKEETRASGEARSRKKEEAGGLGDSRSRKRARLDRA
ncbi:purine and uridine phosphorylase [Aspergillus carlsbadensis]|nr:purine and uridine phosphorylase [Aspergillus carlsbadensis]